MNGDPIVCGGYSDEIKADCFHYLKNIKKWKKVEVFIISYYNFIKAVFHCAKINDLMTPTYDAANVQVPGKGWFLFRGNSLPTAQKLENINADWTFGPEYGMPEILGQCAV